MHGEMRCRTSLFVLTWVGDCKTNLWDLLHRGPHVFNPRVEMSQICRSVDRWNGRFCLSLNSGGTVWYKHNAQFLRLFGLHDDMNDAHRAGANRLKNKNKNTIHAGSPVAKNGRRSLLQKSQWHIKSFQTNRWSCGTT